ncbi:MAG TPA: alkaline phosphatase family protein [Geobacteraceae bacterium]|nr:alkaline phosphatase family protein [Geobacteraceae bacterium]
MAALFRPYTAAALMAIALGLVTLAAAHAADGRDPLRKINHIVVIYQENHSFDNLYGGWEGVDGLAKAHVPQVDQKGAALGCLPQIDVNLASPVPLAATCSDRDRHVDSHFGNAPFPIEAYIAAGDATCPRPEEKAPNGVFKGKGGAGGCTMDLDHRFYQEQYQIDGGKMDRYVAGSNAAGLVMGYYDTKRSPVYRYLHEKGHPHYVIADNFFQAAFGGSFLNHQWLISARTPEWVDAVNDGSPFDLHSVVDDAGMPKNTPLYASPVQGLKDSPLTASCTPGPGRGPTPAGVVCGNFAVNTIQPKAWPYDPQAADAKRLPSLATATIGDRLTAAGIDWAWYSGGWANAEGDRTQAGYTGGSGPNCTPSAIAGSTWPRCPDKLFQFHHQPFNYYAAYTPGTEARRKHLRDEEEFIRLARSSDRDRCNLKAVSFVKPLGADNEHPGYASERTGNSHLVGLLRAIEESACAGDTLVIVTYDEFGGQADHAAPPGPGNARGPYDQWGPGTRIPALVIAPHLRHEFAVDHAEHDTTSILATIEHRFGLPPLGSRDAVVRDLGTVFAVGGAGQSRGKH